MRTLVAAIDDSDAAEAVLVAARETAPLFGDDLVAVTVCADQPPARVVALAAEYGASLAILHGSPTTEIADFARDPDVAALVVGSRGRSAGRAVGQTARWLIESIAKPIVVVPPTWKLVPALSRRVIVPLDGTAESANVIEVLLDRVLESAPVEIVALHVFAPEDVPMFSDQPGHETEAWSKEFAYRWLAKHRKIATVESRVGDPAAVIPAAAQEIGADIVVLAWKQDLSEGRARVITSLLTGRLPIVLVPVVGAELPSGQAA